MSNPKSILKSILGGNSAHDNILMRLWELSLTRTADFQKSIIWTFKIKLVYL